MNRSPSSRGADFAPTASWEALRQRAEMLARLRGFFQQHGFLEVETPLLSADVVVDRHIDPIAVALEGRTMWLQTSPEPAMKRLLAGGGPSIYQITRAFRGGERGALHNVEFTILEWYCLDQSPQQAMRLLSDLAREMLAVDEAECLSYRQAFQRHLEIDPLSATQAELAACAQSHDVAVPVAIGQEREAWLNLLLAERIEPHLGRRRPIILYDYPATQAALAQVRDDQPPVAERFELYVQGVELANGYHELLEAEQLRRRFVAANDQRVADGKEPLPTESRLLDAMRHGLPRCCGVALGFDRLMMIAVGAERIEQVIPFPIDRA